MKQVQNSCLVKHACLLICIETEGVFMPGSAHPPPHIARTQRSSAGAHHAATSRQVITNEWTYMAATIDPETVDGLGGPLGWWRHTENLYKLVRAYRSKFLQSPMPTPFLGDRPWIFAHVLMEPLPSPLRLNGYNILFIVGQIFGFIFLWYVVCGS